MVIATIETSSNYGCDFEASLLTIGHIQKQLCIVLNAQLCSVKLRRSETLSFLSDRKYLAQYWPANRRGIVVSYA